MLSETSFLQNATFFYQDQVFFFFQACHKPNSLGELSYFEREFVGRYENIKYCLLN